MAHALHPIQALAPPPVTGDQRISSTDLYRRLGDVLHRVSRGHQRAIITTHGRPVVAIISVEELECLRAIEREWRAQRGEESP
jgi:prevent-host-death family protein